MRLLDRKREPEGLHICKDDKGQNIYMDPFSKRAYIIPEKKKDRFTALKNVPLYGALAFVFAYVMFELNICLSLAASLIVTLLSEWRFRSFLSSCSFRHHLQPASKHGDRSASSSKTLSMFRAFLHLSLAVILILSVALIKTDDSLIYGGSIALSIAFLFTLIKDLSAFFTK